MNDKIKQEVLKLIKHYNMECLIEDFAARADWFYVSQYRYLSEDFIREFQDRVSWAAISSKQKLSENFLREFQNKVFWFLFFYCQDYSDKIIEEFINGEIIDTSCFNWAGFWDAICIKNSFSDEFLEKYKDSVCWNNISYHRKLSLRIAKKYHNKISYKDLLDNPNLVGVLKERVGILKGMINSKFFTLFSASDYQQNNQKFTEICKNFLFGIKLEGFIRIDNVNMSKRFIQIASNSLIDKKPRNKISKIKPTK